MPQDATLCLQDAYKMPHCACCPVQEVIGLYLFRKGMNKAQFQPTEAKIVKTVTPLHMGGLSATNAYVRARACVCVCVCVSGVHKAYRQGSHPSTWVSHLSAYTCRRMHSNVHQCPSIPPAYPHDPPQRMTTGSLVHM